MAQLVLLVVAAAWAAVLIPPMLRSRVDNHPHSSVTDFRRQLSTLQGTSTTKMRTVGRPLAASPLQRPAAAGRPGQTHPHHRQAAVYTAGPQHHRVPGAASADRTLQPSMRSHHHHGPAHRQVHMDRPHPSARASTPRDEVRRRRSNVLFLLIITALCTLFLAATTGSTVLLYVFALSFLTLCGYVYLLAQLRQRDVSNWSNGWLGNR